MPEWTSPSDWVAEERPTAAKLNIDVRDNTEHLHDWLGVLGYEESIADSAGFTTTETEMESLNVTVPVGGRNIELKAAADFQSTVAGDVVECRIKEGATILMKRRLRVGAANVQESIEFSCRVTAPASGPHTYTFQAVRVDGTGTITKKASAENPSYLRADAA